VPPQTNCAHRWEIAILDTFTRCWGVTLCARTMLGASIRW